MTEPRPMPETWAPGSLIPGTVYRIIRPIGQGGMGEVYEVEHDMLGARRALKVLVKHYAGREDLTERLRVEARGLARLKHPNLVEVYDLGIASDGRIFFAMELLDGVTLRTMLRERGRLSVRTSVELVVQVLAGLHAAHVAGILHRDVKPENVFVCRDGTVKLLDFGVAKAIDAWMPEQKITGAGMTVGTPRYMSPEQAEGRPVDARTDVYATGQMLWEMLAGRPAFDETDPYELVQAKRKRGVMPLAQVGGVEATPALCDAVDRACRADTETRFATAEAFIVALRSAMGSPTPASVQAGAAISGVDTQAYLAGAGRTPQPVAVDTELAPGQLAGFTGTVPLPQGAARELTERVEALEPVNRDAPTQARSGMRMRGPGGTELLPAVAASRERVAPASAPPSAAPGPATKPAPSAPARGRKPGPLGIPLTSWLAGAAAFVVPVLIAAALAYWHLGTPADDVVSVSAAPSVSSAAPVTFAPPDASSPVADEPSELEDEVDEAGVDGAEPVVRSGPPRGTSEVTGPPRPAAPPDPQPEPVATAPATKAAPATKPPPRSPPASTSTRKMPSSGL